MGKKKVIPGTLCAYCGMDVGMDGTEDHVIPRGLFPKTRGRNLVKVPTCRPCNDAKARHDDYLRDWLPSSLDPDDSTTPREVYDAFLRAAGRKQSDVAKAAMQYGRRVPVFAESGLCTGFGHAYPLEGDRVRRLGE